MTDIRERFRKATQRRYVEYSCPQLGDVLLRSLSEAERMGIEVSKLDDEGKLTIESVGRVTAWMIVHSVCDMDRESLFTEDDVEMLSQLDASVAQPLREAINKHALNKRDVDVEEAKKN